MYRKVYFDTLSSTNTYLKQNYKEYDDKTVIFCGNQTNGHGRLGRNWQSNNGNVTLSILLKPEILIESVSRLSLMTSVVIYEVVSKYVSNVQIKWPNDILVSNKKISGILLESIISNKIEALIVGIGLNVNQKDFPVDLKTKATSLAIITEETFDVAIIIDDIIKTFDYFYQDYLKGNHSYLNTCRVHSSIINNNVKINNEYVYVLDILDSGNLLVRNYMGIEYEIAYGEVTLNEEYISVE